MTGISEHKTKAASAAADEYLNLLLSLEGKTKEENYILPRINHRYSISIIAGI